MATLTTAMHDLEAAAQSLKTLHGTPVTPSDAAASFHDSLYIGFNLYRFMSTLTERVNRLLDDPEIDLTPQQREAYQEFRASLHQLVMRGIGLTFGFKDVERAAERLHHLTRHSGHRF